MLAREKINLLLKGVKMEDIKALEEQELKEAETPEEPEVKETPEEPEVKETPEEPEVKESEEVMELKKLVESLKSQLSEAQDTNIHANNESPKLSFEEEINTMFKDYRY